MRLRDGKQLSVEQVDADSDKVVNIDVNKKIQKQDSKDKYADIEMESLVANLEGDYKNVFLLLLLYVLQGIPLGMAGSIPMILQNKNISYKQQAVFSFVYWPFSLKLLWAPIVDAVFYERFGRRKSWLVPVQYLIGLFMIMLSMKVDAILNSDVPNVLFLTVIFFALNFLAATQDIAVDGWALTMLEKRNVGYASTCNSVGQTAGYFIGNVVLLAFSSADFCNKYIRTEPQDLGMITLPGFLFFWGVVFLLTTTLVWIFKHEKIDTDVEDHGVVGTYLMLLKIVKLPAVQELIVVLLTVKIGFSAADAVTGLKLIEAGVKKETLALLAVPLVPLQILLPLVISKFTAGPRPLDVFKRAVPFRLFMGGIFALVVYWTNHIRPEGGQELPYYYFAVILFIYGLHQVTLYSMFVSIMAFFAKVSDPKIGGTYMTLLNTISNLGGNWPATLVLWLVDHLSMKECTVNKLACADLKQKEACTASGGTCETVIDGYYIESSVCIVLGFLWLLWRRHSLTRLQNMREKAWKVT